MNSFTKNTKTGYKQLMKIETLPESEPYIKALKAMSGEFGNAVVHAAVLFLFKHETARKPEFRHYQPLVAEELKRFRDSGSASCI